LGWFVALICYPPFNGLVGRYVPWGANDYALFWSPYWTMVFRILIVALFFIYVLSSVVLGFKASNLTNRGIVTRFPYSLVRHPAYISKNMVWWITLLPVMNWWFFFGMLFWTTIYVLRALTEERHLLSDPDYILYCEKVRYRFIPGLV
jgi:protein-S-isoprenylcysteine O-methyltransferase Ste14